MEKFKIVSQSCEVALTIFLDPQGVLKNVTGLLTIGKYCTMINSTSPHSAHIVQAKISELEWNLQQLQTIVTFWVHS